MLMLCEVIVITSVFCKLYVTFCVVVVVVVGGGCCGCGGWYT